MTTEGSRAGLSASVTVAVCNLISAELLVEGKVCWLAAQRFEILALQGMADRYDGNDTRHE